MEEFVPMDQNDGMMINGKSKRFGVLLCANDSEYVKNRYGGYFGVFVGMLGEAGETWDVYQVSSNEFPNDYELKDFDGFVITGSCNDAHGNDPWILNLLNLLNKLSQMKKKVMGICFGHQVLGRSIGGKIGRNESGWDIGLNTIHISSPKIFSSLNDDIPSTLSIIECHQDEILELPKEAQVIAWSAKTGVEMFRFEDHIMGIQGHPEYNGDILMHLIERLQQRKFIMDSYAEQVRTKFLEVEGVAGPDKDAWRKLCLKFLKGRL